MLISLSLIECLSEMGRNMINFKKSIEQNRLGELLINSHYINIGQLNQALNYQAKRKIKLGTSLIELNFISRRQLNFSLRKQSWARAIATILAITFAPFNMSFASDVNKPVTLQQTVDNKLISESPVDSKLYNQYEKTLGPNFYDSSTDLTLASQSEYFFTPQNNSTMTFNKKIFDNTSLQFSLFSFYNFENSPPYNNSNLDYVFNPQISLFKTSSPPLKTTLFSKNISAGINHYKNTKPAIFMLTLKGRSLYENSKSQTTMWSLNRAKKGVQRKAVLMFSVTKQF